MKACPILQTVIQADTFESVTELEATVCTFVCFAVSSIGVNPQPCRLPGFSPRGRLHARVSGWISSYLSLRPSVANHRKETEVLRTDVDF